MWYNVKVCIMKNQSRKHKFLSQKKNNFSFLYNMSKSLVDPTEIWDARRHGEPVCVINMLEAQLLEHLTGLVVGINNSRSGVNVQLGELLCHEFRHERSKTTTLKALVDLQ